MSIINILDWLENEEVREDEIVSFLSDFSCSVNPEVDDFIHHRAIDFAKRKTAITYFLADDDSGDLTGFFTVTHKSITIREELLSKQDSKKIKQYAVLDENNNYVVSAFLVAQLARNFQNVAHPVSGTQLLDNCIGIIEQIQHMVGGRIVILECEKNNSKLVSFYKTYGFHEYDTRIAGDGIEYSVFLQLL